MIVTVVAVMIVYFTSRREKQSGKRGKLTMSFTFLKSFNSQDNDHGDSDRGSAVIVTVVGWWWWWGGGASVASAMFAEYVGVRTLQYACVFYKSA